MIEEEREIEKREERRKTKRSTGEEGEDNHSPHLDPTIVAAQQILSIR